MSGNATPGALAGGIHDVLSVVCSSFCSAGGAGSSLSSQHSETRAGALRPGAALLDLKPSRWYRPPAEHVGRGWTK